MPNAIPDRTEQLSTDWASAALGVEVLDCRVEDSHTGTTGRARLALQYGPDVALPSRLFVKLPPADPAQREFVSSSGMGEREAHFYRDLAGEVPVRVPRCFFADWGDTGRQYLIVLEDLETSGCRFRNASRHYSLDYLRAVLQAFGQLHARYWDSERFNAELAWLQPPLQHDIGPTLVAKALALHASSMPPVFAELAELYLNHTSAVHRLWQDGEQTLIHGDVHDGNLFCDGETPGFLDWAVVARGPGMRDVSYFLAGTLAPEHRALQWEMLDHYRQVLLREGVAAPDRETMKRRHRCQALYPWVGAVTTLAMGDQWQPTRYVKAALARLHPLLEELDTAGVIREELGLSR